MMNGFRIKDRNVNETSPAYIIAEMSANHAGSFERAKQIVLKYKLIHLIQ
jgi:sialic acid synthase SpsE